MRRRLERARVVALPVRDNSYSGATTVLLQAMALAKPVVVTRTAAIATGYGLEHGRERAARPPRGTSAPSVSRVGELLDDEPGARALGARARATTEETLTWERYVDRIEALLAAARRRRCQVGAGPRAIVSLVRWRAVGVAVLALGLGLALVLLRGDPFVASDQGVFLSVAGRMLDGDRLYADVFDNKDPLFFYTYAGAFWIGGWRGPVPARRDLARRSPGSPSRCWLERSGRRGRRWSRASSSIP